MKNIITSIVYILLLLYSFATCKVIFRDESYKYNSLSVNYGYVFNGVCKYKFEWYIYDTQYDIASYLTSDIFNSYSRYLSGVYQLKSNEIIITQSNQTTFFAEVTLSNGLKETIFYNATCIDLPSSYEIKSISELFIPKFYSINEYSSEISFFFKFGNESIKPFLPATIIATPIGSFQRYLILGFNFIKYSMVLTYPYNRYQNLTIDFLHNSITYQPSITSTKYQDFQSFNQTLKYYPSTKQSYYNIISTFSLSYPSIVSGPNNSSSSSSNGLLVYDYYRDDITIYPIYDTPTERVFVSIFEFNVVTSATLTFTFGPNTSLDSKILLDKSEYSLVYFGNNFSGISSFTSLNIYNTTDSVNYLVLYFKGELVQDSLYIDYNQVSSISKSFQYPFGYKGLLSDNSCLLGISPLVSKYSKGSYSFHLGIGGSVRDSLEFYPTVFDSSAPIITSIKSYDIGSMKIVMEIQIVSIKTGFSYLTQDDMILFDTSKLISGTIYNGTYQVIYDYGFNKTLNYNCIVSGSRVSNCIDSIIQPFVNEGSIQKVVMFDLPINSLKNMFDIDYYYFAFNNINTTNQGVYNSLFFKFKCDNNPNYKIKFIFQISQWYQNPITYYSKWDEKYKIYRVDFYVPANLIRMNLKYSIIFGNDPINIYSNDYFISLFGDSNATLSVYSNNGDMMPPMIKSLTLPTVPSVLPTRLEWKFEIEDLVNGFDYGEIQIRGSIDQIVYRFKLDSRNSTNIYNDIYTVQFTISDQMISQMFDIIYIKLVDRAGHYSEYKYGIQLYQTINPLASLLDNLNLFRFNFTNPQTYSKDSPTISDIQLLPDTIDIGASDNDRTINITFTTQCINSPVLINQDALPIIYIGSTNLKYLEFPTTLNDITSSIQSGKIVRFSKLINIPYGYGSPADQGLTLNIFTVQCERTSFQGFSSNDLYSLGRTFKINIKGYDTSVPSIDSASPISRDGGLLTIQGRNLYPLANLNKFRLDYNQLVKYVENPLLAIGSVAIIEINEPITSETIQISFTNGTFTTSTLTIIPTENYWKDIKPFNIISSSSSSSSDSSTTLPPIPKPICSGTPLCGGPLKGSCDINNYGCVCIYPYSGIDCNSISQEYQFENNQTNPSSNYNITQGSTNYTGNIGIIGIKELGISNNLIKYYDLTKLEWQYNSNGNSNQQQSQIINSYIGNISSSSDGINYITTIINITVQYFNKQTPITFAGYQYNQEPNSFKYTIGISSYAFKSSLNTLQLILKSKLESSGDNNVCSSTQYIISSSNIMKLQIKDITFYSRYINRAIVDNNIVSISNYLLNDFDSDNNQNTNNLVVSYIGINIPNYLNSTQLDPDFSVLLETSSVDKNSNNSNCPSSIQLTSSKIAGIVIGSFVGLVIILLAGILILSKFKYKSNGLMKLHLMFRKNIKL